MPSRPPSRRAHDPAASAAELIVRTVLPRLLSRVADIDAEAAALLSAIDRHSGKAEEAEIRAAAKRMIEAAVREERAKRFAALGTDGTP